MPNPIAQVEPEFTDIGSAKTFVCAALVGETAPLREVLHSRNRYRRELRRSSGVGKPPCDRLRKIRAHARPDRATKRIVLRGVARDDDHRLSPCMNSNVGLRRPVVEGAGPQRPAGPVGADDDARGRSLRVDEREFAWRGSFRKETFARA
jgi:hypothetical protein